MPDLVFVMASDWSYERHHLSQYQWAGQRGKCQQCKAWRSGGLQWKLRCRRQWKHVGNVALNTVFHEGFMHFHFKKPEHCRGCDQKQDCFWRGTRLSGQLKWCPTYWHLLGDILVNSMNFWVVLCAWNGNFKELGDALAHWSLEAQMCEPKFWCAVYHMIIVRKRQNGRIIQQ